MHSLSTRNILTKSKQLKLIYNHPSRNIHSLIAYTRSAAPFKLITCVFSFGKRHHNCVIGKIVLFVFFCTCLFVTKNCQQLWVHLSCTPSVCFIFACQCNTLKKEKKHLLVKRLPSSTSKLNIMAVNNIYMIPCTNAKKQVSDI